MSSKKASKTTAPASKQSHDSATPPNLVQFMLRHWRVRPTKVKPLKHLAQHKARRAAVSEKFPGELIVVPTGHRKVRANDQFYPFRPGSDFFYLTGCHEPDCVLALVPTGKSGYKAVLFAEPNPGKTDASFFTDRINGELWEGPRPGLPEIQTLTGVEECLPLSELDSFLHSEAKKAPAGHRILLDFAPKCEELLAATKSASKVAHQRNRDLGHTLGELRLLKDNTELAELAAVIRATKNGFEDVIRVLKTATSERELETTFWARARQEGNDVGYGTIAAAGEHACTLHWKRNDGKLRPRDLLLLDAGVEGYNLYTADVTRTLPIGGKFSREQREIYDLVLRAQKAAIKAVRPGNDFMEPNRVAMEVLALGLEELGILPMSAATALLPENQFYKRYTLHNVSHMLGLDVHDCAQARSEAYKFGKLTPGMVLTVEPGLYFQPDDLTVPARYRGIGVRIEDDVVVTAKGCRNLSAAVPSEADEVEAWMRAIWKRKN